MGMVSELHFPETLSAEAIHD